MKADLVVRRAFPSRWNRAWRKMSAPARALPRYLIIGAQKCGTDSLCNWLESHPDVVPAASKEIYYFDSYFSLGSIWYRQFFPVGRTTSGEATPDYLLHPRAAERISRTLPDIRLIVLLRDPVARAWSHYHHSVRWGFEKRSFADAIAGEKKLLTDEIGRLESDPGYVSLKFRQFSYLERGYYAKQLQRYFDFFDPEQVLVVKSEELFSDSQAVFDRVARFIGIRPWNVPDLTPRNTGVYSDTIAEREPELAGWLYSHFRPYNEALYDLLGVDFGWPTSPVQRSVVAT